MRQRLSLQDCLKNRTGIVSILRGEDFTTLARFLNNRVLPHGSFVQQLEWGTDNPRFKAKLPACMQLRSSGDYRIEDIEKTCTARRQQKG